MTDDECNSPHGPNGTHSLPPVCNDTAGGPVARKSANFPMDDEMTPFEREVVNDTARALSFGRFLDTMFAPTPGQLWLERAAAQLREERDPGGIKRSRRDRLVARLLARDGLDCWYCGQALGTDVTLEHLTPLALQGSWSDDNLALAHQGCNKAAGHLTLFEKKQLRDGMRAQNQPVGGNGDVR